VTCHPGKFSSSKCYSLSMVLECCQNLGPGGPIPFGGELGLTQIFTRSHDAKFGGLHLSKKKSSITKAQ